MKDAAQKHFDLAYNADTTQDVVLVVECLKYGTNFASLPVADNVDIAEVKRLDTNHIAIRLVNKVEPIQLSISFTSVHEALSNEKAAELIDNGMLDTRIAAAAYRWSDALNTSILNETPIDQVEFWKGKPKYSDNTISIMQHWNQAVGTYEQGYCFSVSPLSDANVSLTNTMLSIAGTYTYEPYYGPYTNGALRIQLPGAYNNGGSVMELTKIRVYEPTELVRLVRVRQYLWNAGGADWYGGDILSSDYELNLGRQTGDSDPNNWVVTSAGRTLDTETGKYYYEVTPPQNVRTFNVASVNKTAFRVCLPFVWQVADANSPLTQGTT